MLIKVVAWKIKQTEFLFLKEIRGSFLGSRTAKMYGYTVFSPLMRAGMDFTLGHFEKE